MLIISLRMGIATFIIDLLPTMKQWGIWVATVLVILQSCQGLGVGGEWDGAVLLAVERSPR